MKKPVIQKVIEVSKVIGYSFSGGDSEEKDTAEYLPLCKTVRNYTSNIFTKLQVADRAQAVIRAREAGLG